MGNHDTPDWQRKQLLARADEVFASVPTISPDECWADDYGPGPELSLEERMSDLDDFLDKLSAIPAVQQQNALQTMHDLLIRAFCSGATSLYLCGDKGSLHAVGLNECQPPPWG